MTDTKKVDVQTASRILGISQDAVRKRIKRGSLTGKQDKNKVWTVTVEDVEQDKRPDIVQNRPDTQALVEAYKSKEKLYEQTIQFMQDTIDSLNRQLEAKDRELEWKDTIFLRTMKELKVLQAPGKSWFRRLLSGRSDE